MYIFKVGELVKYQGDQQSVHPLRNRPFSAIVHEIHEDKFPWVNLQVILTNELVSVHARFIRSVQTKIEHLIKLGFKQKDIKDSTFFVHGAFIIADIVLYPRQNYMYHAGFRIVPSIPFKLVIEDYMVDEDIDNEKFLSDFPHVDNLNFLLQEMKNRG